MAYIANILNIIAVINLE